MHRLTALQVKKAKPGDKLSDGGGLRLDVDKNGNGSWIFRFTSPVLRTERFMGLGPARDVPLADAREAAQDARGLLRQGVDPIEHRNGQRTAAKVAAARGVTFRAYAEGYIAGREGGWKNSKHREQWRNSLATHAYPVIGHIPVADVSASAVLQVLRPLWLSRTETAARIRGRIEMILSAAKAEGLRTGENPAVWRGHLDQLLPPKRKVRKVRHHPALPYEQLPAFWRSLSADNSDAARLLQFVILTVARYNEAAQAEWCEIDLSKRLWSIPAARMKGDKAHAVPLSDSAAALLGMPGDGLLFPSALTGKALSDAALAKCIRRHTALPATTHGFRSTFRDWAGDCTSFPREVAEGCLAHAIDDETEAAYRRSTALEKRRQLMSAWAEYCWSAPAESGDFVPTKAAR